MIALAGRSVVIVAAAAPLGEALVEAFASHGALVAAVDEDGFDAQLDEFAKSHRQLDALVHGAPAVPSIADLDELSEVELLRVVSSGAWPAVSCLLRATAVLGKYPRHTVAVSSSATGIAAAADAVLETLCRNLSAHFNILRHRTGRDLPDRLIATHADVANAAVALCSGWMDSMRGQVLTVDRGASFCDNVFRQFAERAQRAR